jgi:hypothetical protein
MTRWASLPALAGFAVVLVACGPGTTTFSAPPSPSESITITLDIADAGRAVRVRPGDEVVPRLPLPPAAETGWEVTRAPDPRVLGGGEPVLVSPSDDSPVPIAYDEFDFVAVGPGRTTVTLKHGAQEFTFRVEVEAG